MKTNNLKLTLLLLAVILIGTVLLVFAQNHEASLTDIKRTPEKYINQKIIVKGRLRLIGRNYFTDPRFAIEDDIGNQIPVAIWAPLEIPPPPPGNEQSFRTRPKTMGDYVGRILSITGIFRISPPKGESRIEVESVMEIEGR